MPEINREMFAEIYKLITEFPELHRQASWETDPEHTGYCGTTRCIAGWATWIGARNHGLLTRKRQMTDDCIREALVDRLGLTESGFTNGEYYDEYSVYSHPVIGGTLLGLDDDQAHSLFHDMHNKRVVARVKSFAETGADISEEEYVSYGL